MENEEQDLHQRHQTGNYRNHLADLGKYFRRPVASRGFDDLVEVNRRAPVGPAIGKSFRECRSGVANIYNGKISGFLSGLSDNGHDRPHNSIFPALVAPSGI